MPIEKWEAAAKQDEASLENTAYREAEINALGVSDDARTVVYDDGRMIDARVRFILQCFGVNTALFERQLACYERP